MTQSEVTLHRFCFGIGIEILTLICETFSVRFMLQNIIIFCQEPRTIGFVLAIPYLISSLWVYIEACRKISLNAVMTIGGGGVFGPEFGLFIFTLPWSMVLEIKVPSSWRRTDLTYEINLAHFFNDQNHAINFFLYLAFILLNGYILFFIGSNAFKFLTYLNRFRF